MTDTTNTLTEARIKSVLRKAGFDGSKKETTSVRGFYHHTAGYTVARAGRNAAGHDLFVVGHKKDSIGRGVPVKNRAEMIEEYRAALVAFGLSAERSADGAELWVTLGS